MYPTTTRTGARILLLEGDPAERAKYSAWLAAAGCRVATAGSLAEAGAALADCCFDLAIADLDPARSNGLGLLITLRADRLGLRLLAISRGSFLATAHALGAAGTLRKPFERSCLLGAVTAALADQASGPGGRPSPGQFDLGFAPPRPSLLREGGSLRLAAA
ncbi:MAG: response regulator [Alphaproteobacteria bacterium]|nr:response regulator [Alphaproteobacteria bacterium]